MLDEDAIAREVDPVGWANGKVNSLEAAWRANITFAYKPEFLEPAAVLFDRDPLNFRGLAGKLKAAGLRITDWERQVRKALVEIHTGEKARKAEAAASSKAAGSKKANGPAPWAPCAMAAEQVDGTQLVEELRETILNFLMMSRADALLVAIWVLFTHLFEAAETNPFLRIISPRWNCGKSTLLKIIFRLARAGWLVSRSTQAAFYRKLRAAKHTMLLDEGDAFLAENEIWRNILDGASDPDTATVSISVQDGDDWAQADIDVFAPIAIASIGRLKEIRTVESRSVAVNLKRATRAERKALQKARQRVLKTLLPPVQQRCARWAADHIGAFAAARPRMPESMDGRDQDMFEPLFAIAELVSPDVLNEIKAVALRQQSDDQGEEYATMVLSDIRVIFEAEATDRILLRDLCIKLAGLEARPWGEYGRSRKPITSRQLGALLSPYAIVAHTIRLTPDPDDRGLGYYLTDFEDAFERYTPKNDDLNRDNMTTPGEEGESGDFAAVTEGFCHASENGSNPNAEKDCHGFTARNGKNGAVTKKGGAKEAEDAEIDRVARTDG